MFGFVMRVTVFGLISMAKNTLEDTDLSMLKAAVPGLPCRKPFSFMNLALTTTCNYIWLMIHLLMTL